MSQLRWPGVGCVLFWYVSVCWSVFVLNKCCSVFVGANRTLTRTHTHSTLTRRHVCKTSYTVLTTRLVRRCVMRLLSTIFIYFVNVGECRTSVVLWRRIDTNHRAAVVCRHCLCCGSECHVLGARWLFALGYWLLKCSFVTLSLMQLK